MGFGEPHPFPERGSPTRLRASGQQRYEGWSFRVPSVERLGRWRVSMDWGIGRISAAVETDSEIRVVYVQNTLWAWRRPCTRMGRYVVIYWSFLI